MQPKLCQTIRWIFENQYFVKTKNMWEWFQTSCYQTFQKHGQNVAKRCLKLSQIIFKWSKICIKWQFFIILNFVKYLDDFFYESERCQTMILLKSGIVKPWFNMCCAIMLSNIPKMSSELSKRMIFSWVKTVSNDDF